MDQPERGTQRLLRPPDAPALSGGVVRPVEIRATLQMRDDDNVLGLWAETACGELEHTTGLILRHSVWLLEEWVADDPAQPIRLPGVHAEAIEVFVRRQGAGPDQTYQVATELDHTVVRSPTGRFTRLEPDPPGSTWGVNLAPPYWRTTRFERGVESWKDLPGGLRVLLLSKIRTLRYGSTPFDEAQLDRMLASWTVRSKSSRGWQAI